MADPIKSIGQVLKDEDRRDAIHIAIVPVVSDEDYLYAGNAIGLVYGTKTQVKMKPIGQHIGVVDPFITRAIRKGEKFWMFLNPNTVTGMRHQWTHPAFESEPESKSESETWLRKFADKWNFDYDEMVGAAQEFEGCAVAQGIDLHSAGELEAGDEDLFWHHIEVLTGKKFDQAHRSAFGWSCSC